LSHNAEGLGREALVMLRRRSEKLRKLHAARILVNTMPFSKISAVADDQQYRSCSGRSRFLAFNPPVVAAVPSAARVGARGNKTEGPKRRCA
jgi:hypothetical protein